MSYVNPIWLEGRRRYGQRHDWARFIRHDAHRFMTPAGIEEEKRACAAEQAARRRTEEIAEAAEQEEHEREVLALRREFASLKLEYELRRFQEKYSPNQPRVPAGNPDGGQWTSGGGAGRNDPRIISDATPDNDWKAGAQLAQDATQRRYSVNLDEEEAPSGIGHTQRDHVEKTDAELVEVLQKDWLRVRAPGADITQYRPAEGSFLSRESANDFVNRTLEENKEAVDLVASGQEKHKMIERRFGYVTGKEAFRRDADAYPYIRDTYGVRVVIRHDLRAERGYRVYTAFPINEYVTKK